ncbi:MAG: lysophospholipid acyltransferase family protein [Negativicutes bacterium]
MYTLLQICFTFFFKVFFRAELIGRENIPAEGGVILAANHLSNWDPPLLAAFLSRPVSYMAKKELFEVPILKQIITRCHSFPVKRGAADRGAIKAALQELKRGRCIGLFPEGTRSRDGKVHKAESGVALLAAMSGVPVVPAAIIGTERIFSHGSFFPKLRVVYGKPLSFEGKHNDRESLQVFSQKIMEEIVKMIKLHSKE